jgi:hypothetical protein
MMRRRWSIVPAVVAVLGLSLSTVAVAHPDGTIDDGVIDSAGETHGVVHDQHGGADGHLPASNENVTLVGKGAATPTVEGRVSDVAVWGDFAYLGAFNTGACKRGGVIVMDISDLTRPRQTNFIPTGGNSYVGEGVQVINLNTSFFSGDLLVHNNEVCGADPDQATYGGVTLVDVTDPENEVFLAQGVGDFEPESANGPDVAHASHSAFAWQAGDKAYVVMVDNEETEDVDILDITDPRNPVLIAEYDLNEMFPQIIQPELGSAASFHHDVVVKAVGSRYMMLVSYWDGGYVVLDVTNPLAPRFRADSDFTFPDPEAAESGFIVDPEGNAHQAEFSLDNRHIVAADEDFSPYSLEALNTTDGTEFDATQGSDTPPIDADTSLVGQTVYVGLACNTSAPVPAAGDATIALVERGVCTFTEKVANVEAAGGYQGVIVFNREGSDACSDLLNMAVEGGIPAMFVGRDIGFDLLNIAYDEDACRAGDGSLTAPVDIGTLGDSVSISAIFDGWGYVHLFANRPGKLIELDTYAIPEAHDPAFASGFGDLSVHEVAMSHEDSGLAYFAYYAGGFRVARIQDGELVETGHFIDEDGNNFWGVQVFERDGKEYVAASDRDFGLYIFEYTGP